MLGDRFDRRDSPLRAVWGTGVFSVSLEWAKLRFLVYTTHSRMKGRPGEKW